jgi:hypothetical protein
MSPTRPIAIQIANEKLVIANHLTVQGIEIFAAIKILQMNACREAARCSIKPNHHAIYRKGKTRQQKSLHYAGGRCLHLVL